MPRITIGTSSMSGNIIVSFDGETIGEFSDLDSAEMFADNFADACERDANLCSTSGNGSLRDHTRAA